MKNLCMKCIKEVNDSDAICPYCSYPLYEPQIQPFLPHQTILANRYMIGQGLEIDGEGLSYVGYDNSKKSKIYIREFYPSMFCNREENFTAVSPLPESYKIYSSLLESFLKYFRAVARLRNLPALTPVYDIFSENNTAYIISEWVDGVRLDKYVSGKGGRLDWEEAKILFLPMLSSLSRMSAAKVHHLGICPENIIVEPGGKLKLTGFATKNLRSEDSPLNSKLYEGCSALEQYEKNHELGETTDVYGFTSSLFLTLVGEYPSSASKRRNNDKLLIPQSILKSIPQHVITAIANALKIYPNVRTISFETLRIELSNSPVLQVKDIAEDSKSLYTYPEDSDKKSSTFIWGIISCTAALIILIVCLIIYWIGLKNSANPPGTTQNEQNPSAESSSILNSTSNDDEEKIKEEKIPVPKLIGRNFKNLQEETAGTGQYKLALLSEEFHDSIGEGCVTTQTPNYGEEMQSGTIIAVTVSKGPQKRELPNIKGKTLSEAAKSLSDLKLTPVQTREFSNEISEGLVIGYKDYQNGDLVDYGTEVVIIISNGQY